MPNESLNIRASTLPDYQDCARRAIAKSFPDELTAFGYELRRLPVNIGAAVGTSAHAAFAKLLIDKRERIGADDGEAYQLAVNTFMTEIEGGVMTDDTTPRNGVAFEQLKRLVAEFKSSVLPYARPLLVEEGLGVNLGDGFVGSGHMDLFDEALRVEDHKCGANEPHPIVQMGLYIAILRAHGYDVKEARINWLRRCGISKPQPDVIFKLFEVAIAEREALKVVDAIKRGWQLFGETNEPEVFAANPGSMRCKARFCPAYDTGFCRIGGS